MARWLLAGLIALAMAMLTVGSHYVDALQEFSHLQQGKRAVRESCGPYPIADLAPGLLILGLLLLPDLEELGVPGLASLRMRIREREKLAVPARTDTQRQGANLVFGAGEEGGAGGVRLTCHPVRSAMGGGCGSANTRTATRAQCEKIRRSNGMVGEETGCRPAPLRAKERAPKKWLLRRG